MRIYWKIFVGFWLGTFLMVSLAMLVSHMAGGRSSLRDHPPPQRLIRSLERQLHIAGTEGLGEWLSRHPALGADDVFVFGPGGEPRYPESVSARIEGIAADLRARRARRPLRRVDGIYLGRRVASPPADSYYLVLRLPPLWMRLFLDRPLLRYGTALLVSGLVCYLITLVLTRRLNDFSGTVRRLADGDLDARVTWAGKARRGDEIERLAVDFNTMAERLQQLLQSQEQLISGVSHELRSPLARMHLLLALVRRQTRDAGPELSRLEGEIDRLEQIIADLLLLPRLEQDRGLLDETIDLAALLDAVVESRQDQALAQGVILRWQRPAAGEYLVAARGTLLFGVFDNILDNALRYAPAQSDIEFDLLIVDGGFRVIISDQGEGVPEEVLERIFEPFFRHSPARERSRGGVGLGLALALRVAAAHGGCIWAERCDPGLRVCVDLPILDPIGAHGAVIRAVDASV